MNRRDEPPRPIQATCRFSSARSDASQPRKSPAPAAAWTHVVMSSVASELSRMSAVAARFLLLPTHAQVWRLVRAYMELAERGTPGTRHGTHAKGSN